MVTEDRFGPVYAKDYEVLLPLAEKDKAYLARTSPRTKYLTNKAQIITKIRIGNNNEVVDGFYTEEMSALLRSLDICVKKEGDKYIVLPARRYGADE